MHTNRALGPLPPDVSKTDGRPSPLARWRAVAPVLRERILDQHRDCAARAALSSEVRESHAAAAAALNATLHAPAPTVRVPRHRRFAETQACERPAPEAPALEPAPKHRCDATCPNYVPACQDATTCCLWRHRATQACERPEPERVQSLHGIPVGIEHWTGSPEPDPLPLGEDDTLGGAIEDAVDGTGDDYVAQVRVYGWRGGERVCALRVAFCLEPALDLDTEVRR